MLPRRLLEDPFDPVDGTQVWFRPMALLPLDADQLLTTTRAVRKRLDFTRAVDDELIRECVGAAMQSPSGSNNMSMQFVIVRDAATRAAIGEVYRQCFAMYKTWDGVYVGSIKKDTEAEQAQQERVTDSADYLGDHMGEAPVLVIGCTQGARTDGMPSLAVASMMGNILPAMWSFMLAARARGLGTAWTTMHLLMEQQVADILGLPFATVQQVCLSPLAHTVGTDFKAAARPAPDTIIHWDRW
jgi:nitroreductase